MSTTTATYSGPAGAPSAGPTAKPRRRVRRGSGGALGLGLSTLYLSAVVLIPLAAVAAKALEQGPKALWESVTTPVALKALGVTLFVSLLVAAVGAVTGTLV